MPYVAPQNVHDATHIRVLLAKDAISTGWDCPRAEVMFSARPARDRTYITQLLGRMVRTPLARSTPDERLNAVSCFLPHFDRDAAIAIADQITGKRDDFDPILPPDGKVLFSPVELTWNQDVPAEVAEFLSKLPSLPKPKARLKPIRRLLALAAALAVDGLVEDPDTQAKEHLYSVLDGQLAQHRTKVDEEVDDILTAELIRMKRRLRRRRSTTRRHHVVQSDTGTVDDEYRKATRALSVAVANGYVKHLLAADANLDPLQAKATTAALVSVAGVERVEDEAEAKTNAVARRHVLQPPCCCRTSGRTSTASCGSSRGSLGRRTRRYRPC